MIGIAAVPLGMAGATGILEVTIALDRPWICIPCQVDMLP